MRDDKPSGSSHAVSGTNDGTHTVTVGPSGVTGMPSMNRHQRRQFAKRQELALRKVLKSVHEKRVREQLAKVESLAAEVGDSSEVEPG